MILGPTELRKNEFRVLEVSPSSFVIERKIQTQRVIGFLFWRRRTVTGKWVEVNIWGHELSHSYYSCRGLSRPSEPRTVYDSFNKAYERVNYIIDLQNNYPKITHLK